MTSLRPTRCTLMFLCARLCVGLPLLGCGGKGPESVDSEASSAVAGPELVEIDHARRTTHGPTAVRNLDASVEGALAAYERSADPAYQQRSLDLLSLRASMLGRYDDFALMDRLSAEVSPTAADKGQASLRRADFLSVVHRFAEAQDALGDAERKGASVSAIRRARMTLSVALQENLAALLVEAEMAASANPGLQSLTTLALVQSASGQFEEADRSYREALAQYHDSSPFVVAWNLFQRGVMWGESANRPDLARPLYEEAVRRLPGYVVANVHLAELEAGAGEVAAARARLQKLVDAGVQDPEPYGVLARLRLADDPGDAEAQGLVRRAATRYETLLAAYPEAFADHGAEFFAGVGGDPGRAVALALDNLRVRRTPRAYVVAIRAATAADEAGLRCELAKAAHDVAGIHPVLAALVEDAQGGC